MSEPTPPPRHATHFGVYIVLMGIFSVGVAVVLELARPEKDNLPTIAAVFAFAGTILALLKSQETHLSVNSRLDDMMREGKAASRAEGVTEGRNEPQGRP